MARHALTLLLTLLLSTLTLTLAQTTTSTTPTTPSAPTIVPSGGPKNVYHYLGCYNETTGVSGTGGARALDGGQNEVQKGSMTVAVCLAFCGGGSTQYKYAGLEFSRECWCSHYLSAASAKMGDGQCDTTCDGDGGTACGGSLKLSVYMVSNSAAVRITYMTAIIALVGTILFRLL